MIDPVQLTISCKTLIFTMLLSLPNTHKVNDKSIENICKYSKRYKVHPAIIAGVIQVESRFKHFKKPSKTHDHGIMQLHCPPGTKRKMCNRCDIKKLWCNIREGVRYMSQIKKYHNKNCKLLPHYYIQHYNWRRKGYGAKVMKTAFPWTIFKVIKYEQTIYFR